MVAYFERRTSRAAYWSRRLAIFAAVLFIVAGLSHRARFLETEAFLWVLGIIGTLAVLAVCCALWGLSRLWRHGDRGGRASVWGLLIALLVLAPFFWAAWRVAVYPPLTGVSTDLVDPPAFSEAVRRAGSNRLGNISAEEAALQLDAYPDVTGRRYAVLPDQVAEAAVALMAERGWQIQGQRAVPPFEATIEAVALSPVLGFPSDIALRMIDEGSSTLVDLRSVSRYGSHDLGGNARRVVAFLADLDTAMAEQPVE
jgi:hypothetical protein